MTPINGPGPGELTSVEVLLGLTVLRAIASATAGLMLPIEAPESGSSAEAALGIAAASAGTATAVLQWPQPYTPKPGVCGSTLAGFGSRRES